MGKNTKDRWLKRKGTKLHSKFTFCTDSFVKGPHLHQNTSWLLFLLRFAAVIMWVPDIFLCARKKFAADVPKDLRIYAE